MSEGRGRGRGGGQGRGRGDYGGGRGRDGGGRYADYGGGRGRDGGGRRGGRGGRYPGGGGGDSGGRGGRGPAGPAVVAPESAFSHGLLQQPGKAKASGFRKPDAEELASLVGALTVTGSEQQVSQLPLRPGFGQKGDPTTILANHFLIRFKTDATDIAVHYDVDIQGIRKPPGGKGKGAVAGAEAVAGESSQVAARGPQKAQRPLPADKSRLVMTKLSADQRWPVGWSYDGRKSLYSPGTFLKGGPEQDQKFEVAADMGDGRVQSFEVRIHQVAVVSMEALRRWMRDGAGIVPNDTLQAIDIVLRHRASMIPGTVAFGRGSIFVPHPSTTVSLSEGAEVWLGYQQSAKPCQRGLTICINQAAAAFVSGGPLVNRMAEAARLRLEDLRHEYAPQTREYRAMRKAVTGTQIEVTHMGQRRRKYRANGLSDKPADKDMFDHNELGKISVADYFKRQYNMPLRYPKLPCVMAGTRGVRLPPEVCNVVPGMRLRKLTPGQTQQMIRQAAAPPNIKQQTIQKQLEQNLKFGLDPQAAAFGIEVDQRMLQVPARILRAPALEYTQPKRLEVQGGSWNLKTCKFVATGAVSPWAVCCFLPEQHAQGRGPGQGVQQFVQDLTRGLALTGLRFTQGWENPQLFFCNPHSVSQGLRQAVEVTEKKAKRPPTIIVCILPSKDTELYRAVKRAGDSELGVITQCIVAPQAGITTPPKGREQYCANVAMKINHKLGGVNAKLSQTQLPLLGRGKPFMIFGADVTHPGAGSDPNTPSIAAVVGSMDATCGRYSSRIQMQEHRVEIITNLKEAVKGLMMDFYKFTQKKPESVVFYRDGVSEGQFAQVIDQEIRSMREAFSELQAGYQPPVTFVVVQKRHLTRLFPRPGEGDRKGNIHPGTVVDKEICHPHEYDFFLASHEGIQGTVRPVHYHVLLDENKLGADEMQLMTHHLCYLYCRCTRSVSICPPAYYAHLVAERGRLLCSAYASDSDSESSASGRSGGASRPPSMVEVHNRLTNQMFFV